MHIVYVTPEFVTENKGGGLASYLANIARIMVLYGHQVTIVVASEQNDDAIVWQENITVERVKKPQGNLLVPVRIMVQSRKLHVRVKQVHRKHPIDFIQYASYEAVGLFHSRRIPSAVRISSDCVSWREYKVYDYCEEDIRRCYLTDRLEYHAEKKIGNIYGPSHATAELVSERIHCPISIIESPFFLTKTEYDNSVYDEILQGKKYYLSHSSMSCLKGSHVIAQAIPEICERDPEAYFVFAGSDHGIFYRDGKSESAKDYILRYAGQFADRIVFLGTLDRKSLFPIVKHAFACLMPSRIDNMPNTCIEAMSMGKIVIGTRGASYEQLIEDGVSGYLVGIDCPEELIAAVFKVNALSEDERRQMEDRAKEVTGRFEPEETYKRVIRYYEDIIREKAGRET